MKKVILIAAVLLAVISCTKESPYDKSQDHPMRLSNNGIESSLLSGSWKLDDIDFKSSNTTDVNNLLNYIKEESKKLRLEMDTGNNTNRVVATDPPNNQPQASVDTAIYNFLSSNFTDVYLPDIVYTFEGVIDTAGLCASFFIFESSPMTSAYHLNSNDRIHYPDWNRSNQVTSLSSNELILEVILPPGTYKLDDLFPNQLFAAVSDSLEDVAINDTVGYAMQFIPSAFIGIPTD